MLWLSEIDLKEIQIVKNSKKDLIEDKKIYIFSFDIAVRMADKILKLKS